MFVLSLARNWRPRGFDRRQAAALHQPVSSRRRCVWIEEQWAVASAAGLLNTPLTVIITSGAVILSGRPPKRCCGIVPPAAVRAGPRCRPMLQAAAAVRRLLRRGVDDNGRERGPLPDVEWAWACGVSPAVDREGLLHRCRHTKGPDEKQPQVNGVPAGPPGPPGPTVQPKKTPPWQSCHIRRRHGGATVSAKWFQDRTRSELKRIQKREVARQGKRCADARERCCPPWERPRHQSCWQCSSPLVHSWRRVRMSMQPCCHANTATRPHLGVSASDVQRDGHKTESKRRHEGADGAGWRWARGTMQGAWGEF